LPKAENNGSEAIFFHLLRGLYSTSYVKNSKNGGKWQKNLLSKAMKFPIFRPNASIGAGG
jgi:hypothetical protein